MRDARQLRAEQLLEFLQRAGDASGARARQGQIAWTQVIPHACGPLVVLVESRRELAGELLARQPVGAPGARGLVECGVQARLPPGQRSEIGAPNTTETGPEASAGAVHVRDHRREARGQTRAAA